MQNLPRPNRLRSAAASKAASRTTSSTAKPTATRTAGKLKRPAGRTANELTKSQRFFSQAEAASKLFAICEKAIGTESRAYVQDKAGKYFLTLDPLDPTKRDLDIPVIVDVSAPIFKSNFSHFSSLVKMGMCFRLRSRGWGGPIYARARTDYEHPLEAYIQRWQDQAIESELAKRNEQKLLKAIEALSPRGPAQSEVLEAIHQLKQGIARLAIGHTPFQEGPARRTDFRVADEAPIQRH